MSCAGHLQEARLRYIERNFKVTLVLNNVTIEEIAEIRKFLKEYRERKKQ